MEVYSRKVSSTSGMEKEILGQIQALEMCSPRDEGAHRPMGKKCKGAGSDLHTQGARDSGRKRVLSWDSLGTKTVCACA